MSQLRFGLKDKEATRNNVGKGQYVTGDQLRNYISSAVAYAQSQGFDLNPSILESTVKHEAGGDTNRGVTNPGMTTIPGSTASGIAQMTFSTFQGIDDLMNPNSKATTREEYTRRFEAMARDPQLSLKYSAKLFVENSKLMPAEVRAAGTAAQTAWLKGAYSDGASVANKWAQRATSNGKFDVNAFNALYDAESRAGGAPGKSKGYTTEGGKGGSSKLDVPTSAPKEVPNKAGASVYQDVVDDSGRDPTDMTKVVPSVSIQEGLDDVKAWWEEDGLVVGNPHLKRIATPAWFEVQLDEKGGNYLSNKGVPSRVKLNTSLSMLSIRYKHVVNKHNTKTGFHLTFWGQEPNIITGRGSTGAFINQFGLSAIMSIADADSAMGFLTRMYDQYMGESVYKDRGSRASLAVGKEALATSDAIAQLGGSKSQGLGLLGDLFSLFPGNYRDSVPGSDSFESGSTSDLSGANAEDDEGFFQWLKRSILGGADYQVAQRDAGFINSRSTKFDVLVADKNALRIAAQDAFVELLSLFKNNGQIRFRKPGYNGSFDKRDQLSETVWSPEVGANSFQINSRNNDVMTRGYVVFRYKGRSYLGYFKSLNFNMDASKPFQWEFDFTFQVLKSLSISYEPNYGQ